MWHLNGWTAVRIDALLFLSRPLPTAFFSYYAFVPGGFSEACALIRCRRSDVVPSTPPWLLIDLTEPRVLQSNHLGEDSKSIERFKDCNLGKWADGIMSHFQQLRTSYEAAPRSGPDQLKKQEKSNLKKSAHQHISPLCVQERPRQIFQPPVKLVLLMMGNRLFSFFLFCSSSIVLLHVWKESSQKRATAGA